MLATNAFAPLILLAVIGLAVILIDVLLILMMASMRRTMAKLEALLPDCHRTVTEANDLLTRTNRMSKDVETVVHRATGMIGAIVDQAHLMKTHAESVLTGLTGNGAKPRRFRRRPKP